MNILTIIIFFLCSYIMEYFVIKFEIRHNKELFYDLHKTQIERELEKVK